MVADTGHTGMRPNCPLMAASPVRQPGMRTEPPPSVPSAIERDRRRRPKQPRPALDPPGVFARFHGLRVMPVSGLSPTPLQPNSLVVVLPIRMRAGLFRALDRGRVRRSDIVRHAARAEREALAADRDQVLGRERHAVQQAEAHRRASPHLPRPSPRPAPCSGIRMKNALSEPCVASALSSARRVTSTGETSRRAIRPRSSMAVIASKSEDCIGNPGRGIEGASG